MGGCCLWKRAATFLVAAVIPVVLTRMISCSFLLRGFMNIETSDAGGADEVVDGDVVVGNWDNF